MAQRTSAMPNSAAVDYNFSRFDALPQEAPRRKNVRVAPTTRTRQQTQRRQMMGVLVVVGLLAILGAMVISTYATLGELRSEISRQNTQLTNEEAIYSDLMFQLESKTNLNQVEQRAQELGFVKIDKSQVTYIRVVEENQIEAQKSTMEVFFEVIIDFFKSLFGMDGA